MRIGEFAEKNNVTAKMLRHYDEIGLLKPAIIDDATGYRSYEIEQSRYLSWIVILKNLDFSLTQIKEMLNGPVDYFKLLYELKAKRISISSTYNEQIQKKIQIDRLIKAIEKEGFQMDKLIDLLSITPESVHEIKKNMLNMEMFLETVYDILDSCTESDDIMVMRFDIYHFKQVNDDFGFDIGDRVIVACYNLVKANAEKFSCSPAIGRAHGDEFILFAKAGMEETKKVTQSIISDLEAYDFAAIGCNRKIGCYIGCLIEKKSNVQDIRDIIDHSIDLINEAKEKGKNSVVIRSL